MPQPDMSPPREEPARPERVTTTSAPIGGRQAENKPESTPKPAPRPTPSASSGRPEPEPTSEKRGGPNIAWIGLGLIVVIVIGVIAYSELTGTEFGTLYSGTSTTAPPVRQPMPVFSGYVRPTQLDPHGKWVGTIFELNGPVAMQVAYPETYGFRIAKVESTRLATLRSGQLVEMVAYTRNASTGDLWSLICGAQIPVGCVWADYDAFVGRRR
ncbi:MAG: hypothetical protein AAGF59_11025 [Pseudomonadota bacterium]